MVTVVVNEIGYDDTPRLMAVLVTVRILYEGSFIIKRLTQDCATLAAFSTYCASWSHKHLGDIVAELIAGTRNDEICAKLEFCVDSPTSSKCPLIDYTSSTFINESPRVHPDFLSALLRVEGYARACQVLVYVTSSFR